MEHRTVWPFRVSRKDRDGWTDIWPLWVAALASLSGWLDDATAPAELDNCIRHGWSLINCGIYSLADVKAECETICRLDRERFERVCLYRDPAFFGEER